MKHLLPEYLPYEIPAQPPKGKKPGRAAMSARIYIAYSHHCFTQAIDKVDHPDPDEFYTCISRQEPRVFCPRRWRESKALPELVRGLGSRTCYFTRHHNYFAVRDPLTPGGHYVIYFTAKGHASADVALFVESAYIRHDMADQMRGSDKISLNAILVNVLRGQSPKRPRGR